ncbi:MAG: hypothetical protein KGJ93_00435 [Patescibacteria group bacterium]|nr:hypothetical protein [Patescibacteria group bacterium]
MDEQQPQNDSPFVKKSLSQNSNPGPAPARVIEMPLPQPSGAKNFYRENRWYIWGIALAAATIGVLSYFAFRKVPLAPPKEANVSISVDVPQTVPAGGEAVYKIVINNQDTQKLVQMSLEVNYADGLSYESSSPNADNLSGTQFTVPDLIPGQNATIFLKAKASGNINDQKDLSLKLHYHYANFNSEFIKQQAASVRLVAADVVLELDGPATTNNAQLVVYTVKYQNNSNNDIQNARVTVDFPNGFSFASANPQPDSGNNTWNISSLPQKTSGTISIQGNFTSANPGESKTATANFLVLGQCPGGYCTQATFPFTTQIASLPLLVSQQVDGADNNIAKPGDTLTFRLAYQNNGSVAATGVNIIATLNSKALDLTTLRAEGGQVSNNTILWNASSEPNLASLNPSDGGQLTFTVQIKDPATKDSSKNLDVLSTIKIKSSEYDTYFPGNQTDIKIASPVGLVTALTYQSGQLPPQVGKQTDYQVSLTLTNATNDMNNATLTASIPVAGGFVGSSVNSAEAGRVQFDPATGQLSWQVGSLPAHTGQFTAPRTLSFTIRLVPAASQAGTSPTLVKNLQFAATDTYTNQSAAAAADSITTNALGGGYGLNGTVQR